MNDRVFLDTNVLVYSLLENGSSRHAQALQLMESLKGNYLFISTQVVNEVYVALLKHTVEEKEIETIMEKIIRLYNISATTIQTIKTGWGIRRKYKFSYWDCIIIASALESNCTILYTEDMQDGQIIEGKLRIRNPFSLKKRT